MKTLSLKAWGKTHRLWCKLDTYQCNGSLAIQLYCDEGAFATLTVNLADGCARGEYAYVDTNNCPWAPAFIAEHKLGVPTGILGFSGFCQYPLYRFDIAKLKESAA